VSERERESVCVRGEGVEERLFLRASYRCIYRTLRQLIKFSPKPSQTKNTIHVCVCVCVCVCVLYKSLNSAREMKTLATQLALRSKF